MNLVFASGFLVPQKLPGIDYFRGLKEHLAQTSKHETLFPPVPPTGSCEERAPILAKLIDKGFPSGPVHIIAHSMGGLDSRFLIGNDLLGLASSGRIASLTTLSTPHRGSPVADLLAGPEPDSLHRSVHDLISRAVGLLGISSGAIASLTTQSASSLPDAAKLFPKIRYRSYFASGRPVSALVPLPTSLALAATHQYILQAPGGQVNDGLVTLDSAQYGDFQKAFWECDHADMVGYNLDPVSLFRFNHLAAYDAIISQL